MVKRIDLYTLKYYYYFYLIGQYYFKLLDKKDEQLWNIIEDKQRNIYEPFI